MSTVTLPNVRIMNDVRLQVTLKDSGVAVDWSDVTIKSLCMYSEKQKTFAGSCTYTVDSDDPTVLHALYPAEEQYYLGKYRIIASIEYEDDRVTYDAEAFTMVGLTEDVEDETIEVEEISVGIQVSSIDTSILTSIIAACQQATDDANTAKASANTAATSANNAASSATSAASAANSAAASANAKVTELNGYATRLQTVETTVEDINTYDVGTRIITLTPIESFIKDDTYGYRVYVNSSNEAYINKSSSNVTYNAYGFAVERGKTYKVLAWGKGVSTGNVYGVVVANKYVSASSGTKQTPSLIVGSTDGTTSYKSREIEFTSPINGFVYICNKATIDAYCKTETSEALTLKEYFGVRDSYIDAITDKMKSSCNYGKSMAIFGGSVAMNASYCRDYFSSKLNLSIDSYAIGGAGFHKATDCIQDQVDTALASGNDYDIFLFWCSTNDWSQNRTIGSKDDYINETFDEPTDNDALSSQCGGMNYCFYKIKKAHPNAQILLFTSARAFDRVNGYQVFNTDSNALVRYVDAQIEVCNKWGIPYFDQFRAIDITPFTKATYLADDKHPSVTGYKYIRQYQCSFLAAPFNAGAIYGSKEMDIASKINNLVVIDNEEV